jgi:hexosaminidase
MVARGSKVILTPGSRLYLDMQWDSTAPLGLHWAGYTDLRKAYDWEPASFNPRIPESAILGLEGALWAETLGKLSDYEYMALPRLTALAELAWSPPAVRNWDFYRRRIPAHEMRWTALGMNYHRFRLDAGPATR